MRFRLLNNIPKALRSSVGCSQNNSGRISTVRQCRSSTPQPSHQPISIQKIQQRLFTNNSNTVQLARKAICVEGCTTALTLLVEGVNVEPNLPRGWDAGVMDDDDDGG